MSHCIVSHTYLLPLSDDVAVFLVGIQRLRTVVQQNLQLLVGRSYGPVDQRQQSTQSQADVRHGVAVQAQQSLGEVKLEERTGIQVKRHRAHVDVQAARVEASTLCQLCRKHSTKYQRMVND